MNKVRRAQIALLVIQLEELSSELDGLKEEEQDYLDNMPESLKGGEKGEAAQEAIDKMQDAFESIEYASNQLSELA